MRKKALSCLLVLLLLTSGCSRLKEGVELGLDVEQVAQNLDPQFATDPTDQSVLLNLFEGLVVQDGEGVLHPGAAESWTISSDGTTYTFYLRKDAFWPAFGADKKSVPLQGGDFVFAFQRLFTPQHPSPYYKEYLTISGSEGVASGVLDSAQLGVKAVDDFTLEIQLTQKNERFLELLSRPAALPCQPDFFQSTRGRYGAGKEYVLGNGPFSLSLWEPNNRLSLEKNPKYKGESKVQVDGVHLFAGRTDREDRFKNGTTHILRLSGDQIAPYKEDYTVVPREEYLWALLFRGGSSPWGIPYFRKALQYAFNPKELAETLPSGYAAAQGFISQQHPQEFNVAKGNQELAKGLSALGVINLPPQTIHLPTEQSEQLQSVVAGWAGDIGLSFRLEKEPLSDLTQRVASRDFDLLLYPLPITEGPESLTWFTTNHTNNYFGYQNHVYDKVVGDLHRETTVTGYEEKRSQGEGILLQEVVLLPLYIEEKYYILDKKAELVDIYPNGRGIRFHKATTAT